MLHNTTLLLLLPLTLASPLTNHSISPLSPRRYADAPSPSTLYTPKGHPVTPLASYMKDGSGCYAVPPRKAILDAHQHNVWLAVRRFCTETLAGDGIIGKWEIDHERVARPMQNPVTKMMDTTPVDEPEIRDMDVFEISVGEVDEGVWGTCEPDVEFLDLMHPKGVNSDWERGEGRLYDCHSVLFAAWKECTGNQGRGGWIQSGCGNYSIRTVY